LALELHQPGDHGSLDRLPAQIGQSGFVDDILVAATPQQRQEVQARFRPAGAEDRKALAADLGGDPRTAGMPCAGIGLAISKREALAGWPFPCQRV
jgi:hypothetical protein